LEQQLDRVIPGRLTRLNSEALRHWFTSHCLSRPLLRKGTVLRDGANRKKESRVVTAGRVGTDELHLRAKTLERARVSRVIVSAGQGGQ
jgi:hypothetical protein